MLTVKEYKESRRLSEGQWERLKAKAKEGASGEVAGADQGANQGGGRGVAEGLTIQKRGVWYVNDPDFLDRFLPSTVTAARPEVVEAELVDVEPVAIAPIADLKSAQLQQDLAIARRTDQVISNIEATGAAIAQGGGAMADRMADRFLLQFEQRFNARVNAGVQAIGQKYGVVQPSTEGNE